MSFIDTSYFINDISVPVNQYQEAYLIQYITRWENEILKRLLGYTLWKALIADLDGGNPQTPRFTYLVNGTEFSFEYDGHTINTKWEGLRNTQLVSLIAYWVYFNLRNEKESFYTGIGQRRGKGENSVMADPVPKLVSAWNKMIDLYGYTPKYYYPYNNSTIFNTRLASKNFKVYLDKEYFLDQSNYEHYTTDPSAYNFLLANINDYPEWVFDPIRKFNVFGM